MCDLPVSYLFVCLYACLLVRYLPNFFILFAFMIFVFAFVLRSPRLVSQIQEAWSSGVVDEPVKARRKKKK